MPEDESVTINGLGVTRVGRGHYLVASQSKDGISYSVDLLENCIEGKPPLGSCNCADFNFNRYPKFKRVQNPHSEFRCRHINAARALALDQILMFYAKEEMRKK